MRFFAWNIELARKAECAHAVNQAEVDRLRAAALFAADALQRQTKDLCRRRAVDILPFRKRGQQALVAGKMRHDAQFNLRVVSRDNEIIFRSNKRLTDTPPFFVAHRNVLQVRVCRRQTSRCRNRLVIRGVNPARFRADHQRQLIGIGGFEFCQTTILEDDFRQRIVQRQLFQHLFRGRRRAARGFLQRLNTLFFKQDGLQLLRRREVKLLTRDIIRLLLQFNQAFGYLLRMRMQHGRINLHPVTLYAG